MMETTRMPQPTQPLPIQAITHAPRDVGVIDIRGDDAESFLQAQLSSDVRKLTLGSWQWSAWLDPQGRVRALMQLARLDATHYIALLRGGEADALASSLRRYILRARVQIDSRQCTLQAGPGADSGHIRTRANVPGLDMGTHIWWLRVQGADANDANLEDNDNANSQAWADELRGGLPWLPADALNTLPAQALGLEHLGAASVEKGCYPGQEIVARLHFRGGNKRQLVRLAGEQQTIAMLMQQHPAGFQALTAHAADDGSLEVLGILSSAAESSALFAPLVTNRYGN